MNAPVLTQDNLLFTVQTPLGKDQLLFNRLQGEEVLNGLFHFHLEMHSESKDLDFEGVVGKNMTVKVEFAPSHVRYFNGVVTRFVQGGTFVHPTSQARLTVYHAELRPWLWQLTLTKNCRIFQNLSVPEIISQIFDELGFTDYRQSLIYQYEKRVYCVQYEETAFNFVCRLMEDEGIFYFFEHEEERHVLVMADDLGVHQPCPGIDTVRFWPELNETQPEDVVTECQFIQQLTTSKYAVDDFNFETPSNDLMAPVEAAKGSQMRIYEYAAGFDKRSQGEQKVNKRLESHLAEHQLLEGQGHCFSFTAGYQFQLTQHPRKNFNDKYVLRWVSHSLSFDLYQNAFLALPADVIFRPTLITPKPKIVSTQTAIVTGPAGEEIYTDKYGRIKVQFHWDQEGKYDENSSCWIRVNQGWAGKGWGSMFMPRIGQEVIVSFLNGDPDRPLVTGAVYNSEQFVPYPLPDEQTKSTIKTRSVGQGPNSLADLIGKLTPIVAKVAALAGSLREKDKTVPNVVDVVDTLNKVVKFVEHVGGRQPGNSNELRFEDKPGKEEIYVHAKKNTVITVENDMTTNVGSGESLTVVGGRDKVIGGNESSYIIGDDGQLVGGDKSSTIYGNFNTTIEGVNFSHFNSGIAVFTASGVGDKIVGVTSMIGNVIQGEKGQGNYTLTLKKGDKTTTLDKGSDKLIVTEKHQTTRVKKGNRSIDARGEETYRVRKKRRVEIKGDETHTNNSVFIHKVKKDYVLEVKGNLTIKANKIKIESTGGSMNLNAKTELKNQAGSQLINKAKTALHNQAGTSMTNKAKGSLTNEATGKLTNKSGASLTNEAKGKLTNKASGIQEAKASGVLLLKGSLIKVN